MTPYKQTVTAKTAMMPPAPGRTRAQSALARAAALHLEDRREEALQLLEGAIASGESTPELLSAKASGLPWPSASR